MTTINEKMAAVETAKAALAAAKASGDEAAITAAKKKHHAAKEALRRAKLKAAEAGTLEADDVVKLAAAGDKDALATVEAVGDEAKAEVAAEKAKADDEKATKDFVAKVKKANVKTLKEMANEAGITVAGDFTANDIREALLARAGIDVEAPKAATAKRIAEEALKAGVVVADEKPVMTVLGVGATPVEAAIDAATPKAPKAKAEKAPKAAKPVVEKKPAEDKPRAGKTYGEVVAYISTMFAVGLDDVAGFLGVEKVVADRVLRHLVTKGAIAVETVNGKERAWQCTEDGQQEGSPEYKRNLKRAKDALGEQYDEKPLIDARAGTHPVHPKCPGCAKSMYKSMKAEKVFKHQPWAFCRNVKCALHGKDQSKTEAAPTAEATAATTAPEFTVEKASSAAAV